MEPVTPRTIFFAALMPDFNRKANLAQTANLRVSTLIFLIFYQRKSVRISGQISGDGDRAERIFSDSTIASARRKSSCLSPLTIR
jgi:hypothetical protein